MKTSPQRFSLAVVRAVILARVIPVAFLWCCAFAPVNVCAHAQVSSSTIVAPVPVPNTTGAPQTAPRGQSVITGRVVYEDTGRPARSVQLLFFDQTNPGAVRRAATNARGEFRLKQVAAGRYRVVVEALGIVPLNPPVGDQNQSDVQEVSVDGTGSAEIEVRAKRGGVITGRVTYADGEPAIGARVSIMRKRNDRMEPFNSARFSDSMRTTDDRGVYRIAGLPSGDYLVSAAAENIRIEEMENGSTRSSGNGSLSVTYFPSATNTRSATPVNVTQGSETGDINITLIERITHRVAGTVIVRRGNQPLVGAWLTLRSKEDAGNLLSHQSAQADAQGRFAFTEVPDGAYFLNINPPPPEPVRGIADEATYQQRYEDAMRRFVPKRQEVTVAGADVTGLAIEMTEGGRIKGTVVVEGSKPLPANLVVTGEHRDGEGMMQIPARVQPDGTWTLGGIAEGKIYLSAFVPYNKYFVKSIILNGADILREPLSISDGAEISNVRIILSPDVATLTGRVLSSDGAPVRNAGVFLITANAEARQSTPGSRLFGRTNSEGIFTINGAPGEYQVLILRPGDRLLKADDDSIKPYIASPQRITLQPNERKNIDIIAPGSK